MEAHSRAVMSISSCVRGFHDRQEAFRIYHGSTNSTRPSIRQRDKMVDTSKLNNVLEIDAQARFALAEPNVPMDDLVDATMRHGLIPPVVMEFPGITVGGGFAGTAGESSSFRYGFFDKIVSWVEMVLANGDVVTASKDHNSDLFYGAASSFGTLGITTLLKVELKEARKYVRLTYQPVSSVATAIAETQKAIKNPAIDYVDGIIFSPTLGVVCSGRLTDDASSRVQCFSRASDPWFYLRAEHLVESSHGELVSDLVPLRDYLFRYDRGAFWTGKYAYQYFITPFNRVTRWALDYFMHTRVMYHALHKSGQMSKYILQDVAIPFAGALEFSKYLDETFGKYPLWICPLSMSGQAANAPSDDSLWTQGIADNGPDAMLNFGVWFPGPRNRHTFVEANRDLEREVSRLNGRKWLYALTYHTEEEFWAIYEREKYDALRAKYSAAYLPTVYDKVKADIGADERAMQTSWMTWLFAVFWSIWPLSGLYGVYKAAAGGDYMLSREGRVSKSLVVLAPIATSMCLLIVGWSSKGGA